MRKEVIAVMAATAAVMTSAVTNAAFAEGSANNSISGYVSLSEGVKIAGEDKAPRIHIDADEYSSVTRAAGDLAEDIKSVTGAEAEIVNDDITLDIDGGSGIIIDDAGMGVSLDFPVQDDCDCYIAVYDKNGALTRLKKTSAAAGQTSFIFDSALSKPEGGSMKAFVWDKNMQPVTDTLDMLRTEGVNLSGTDILIGTLGQSAAVDTLAKNGDIDTRAINGKWEAFTLQQVDDTIVIAGSDKRGTIYGIYDLCEKMGISPWRFFADAEPETADAVYVNLPEGGYTEGEPSVKYRGIFLNDEYNFNNWTTEGFPSNVSIEKYEKVYELILRLKANTLWPAMHNYSTAFHRIDGAAELADEYGIVIGSSHAESLLRNNLGELDDYQDAWEAAHPDKTLYKALENESKKKVAYYWTDHDNNNNPVDNKEFLEDYWRDSVKANGQYDNIYTLGMRGVHDGSFQTNMDYATALNEIIQAQYKILKEEIADKQGIDVEDIPKVFIPYKDIQGLYNQGKLVIPDDVTIMWTDDNYGYVRQSANDAERARSGGAGLYYHVSYYGWPTSYLWLSSTQPGLIREELTKTYDMGSDKMWILNVGDLKPAEKEIEYYAKLSRNIAGIRETDIADIYSMNAKRDFNMSDEDAAEYAEIMDIYYELANSKRPEFYRTGDVSNKLNLSITAYGDEAKRYLDRYNDIAKRAETLYEKLPSEKKDAFFELALYPIRSAKNIAEDSIEAYRAQTYNAENRGGIVNVYSGIANADAEQIDADTSGYNTMLGGKWSKMMVINPAHFTSCDAKLTLNYNPPSVTELGGTAMGISVNGVNYADDETPAVTLSKYDAYSKYIDIYNTGYGSFEYTVTNADESGQSVFDCIEFSKTSGTAEGMDRVYLRLRAGAEIPYGKAETGIVVTALSGDEVIGRRQINISVSAPSVPEIERMYVEADGTVSVEAEHYTDSVANGVYEWKVEKDFGRSGDSLKIYPNKSDAVSESNILTSSAYTEYNIYFTGSGSYHLTAYRMPTLNEREAMRFAVGIDDGEPVVLRGTSAYSGSRTKTDSWANGILANTEKLSTAVNVPSEGLHKLRLYNVSAGVTIDKIVLSKDAAPYSYFGAPESYNTTYNNSAVPFPVYRDLTDNSGIKKLYTPDVPAAKGDKLYGEDFESYTVPDGWNGMSAALTKKTEEENSYIVYTSNGGTIGAWTALGDTAADLTGKTVTLEADIQFAPSGTAGNSQIAIGGSSPSFVSKNINYGIDSSGNIFYLAYNTGSKLVVNDNEQLAFDTSDFIGSWCHMTANINFTKKSFDITLSNGADAEKTKTINGISFTDREVNEINSLYLRAAKPNGTVSIDNIEIYDSTEPMYAVSVAAVDDETGETADGAVVTLKRVSSGEITAPEMDGVFAGKYLIVDDEYTISVTADGYEDVNDMKLDNEEAFSAGRITILIKKKGTE